MHSILVGLIFHERKCVLKMEFARIAHHPPLGSLPHGSLSLLSSLQARHRHSGRAPKRRAGRSSVWSVERWANRALLHASWSQARSFASRGLRACPVGRPPPPRRPSERALRERESQTTAIRRGARAWTARLGESASRARFSRHRSEELEPSGRSIHSDGSMMIRTGLPPLRAGPAVARRARLPSRRERGRLAGAPMPPTTPVAPGKVRPKQLGLFDDELKEPT